MENAHHLSVTRIFVTLIYELFINKLQSTVFNCKIKAV